MLNCGEVIFKICQKFQKKKIKQKASDTIANRILRHATSSSYSK